MENNTHQINLQLECIQRHMESDHEMQLGPDIRSLYAMDSSDVSEFDFESEFGLAWSGCSPLSLYLTKKAASIDSSIKWSSITSSLTSTGNFSNKRRSCDRAAPSRKRQRCESMEDLAANMLMFQEILNASISGAHGEQYNEVYMTNGGSGHSGPNVLSRAATFIHHQDTNDQIDNEDLNSLHHICQAENPECSRPTACTKTSADSCFSDLNSLHSTCDLRSLLSCASRTPSMRISNHTASQVTVLFIDIKGFTSACAGMPAGRVGEWVADFYERVDAAAAAHGVAKAEVRGDCCICVAGAAGAVPARAFARASADPRGDQATRMLAFAAALHKDLQTLAAGGAATATRMGIATGEASFLVSDAAAAAGTHFVSVQGDAAALAARMESLAAPGAVYVHRSAALRWAAEARCPPPATMWVDCGGGGGAQRAAVFDCAAGAFRAVEDSDGAAAAAVAAPLARLRKGALRRRRSAPI
jgi:class 3 adenylate cyclase